MFAVRRNICCVYHVFHNVGTVNNGEAGRAAFERVCREIETGVAHWVARQVDPGPYRLRANRQTGADDDFEDDEYPDVATI